MRISPTDIAFLKSTTPLGYLPVESGFDRLAADPEMLFDLEPGDVLLEAGAESPGLYVMVHGAVELVLTAGAGHEKIVEFAKTGDFLCEEGLFSGTPRPYSVRALTQATVLRLPEERVGQWIERYPEFGRHLLALINERIEYFSRDVFTQRTKNATARLVCYLLCQFNHAPRTPDGSYFLTVPLPRRKLAARLGITSEHLSRAFRELREQGLIVSEGSGYFIPDVLRLSAYVCPAGCDW
ncbi:MAG: cAMP-binding protein [Rhodocyclaceae bacterium]|nr:cAMP-binding protein [Rhodocyclaceae bacterium]